MIYTYTTFPKMLEGTRDHACIGRSFSIKNDFGPTSETSYLGFVCACGDEFRVRVSDLMKKGCPFQTMVT